MLPNAPQPPSPSPNQAPVSTTDRVAQVVWIVFGLIEALVALRVVLKLLAANLTPDLPVSSMASASRSSPSSRGCSL